MTPEITLINFQKSESAEDFETQLQQVKTAIQSVGGKFIAAYLTQGRYDAAVLTEMPNPEHSASVWLPQKQQGWKTETLPCIPESAIAQVYTNAHRFQRAHA